MTATGRVTGAPWYRVVTADGVLGYMYASLVEASTSPSRRADEFEVQANTLLGLLAAGRYEALVARMHFPADYTVAFVADVVIGWTLVGLVVGAVIRPVSSTSASVGETPPSAT